MSCTVPKIEEEVAPTAVVAPADEILRAINRDYERRSAGADELAAEIGAKSARTLAEITAAADKADRLEAERDRQAEYRAVAETDFQHARLLVQRQRSRLR